MTLKEIKDILISAIKNQWLVFSNQSDSQYFIKEIRTTNKQDFENLLSELQSTNIQTGFNIIQDMQDEFDNISE